jgi:hypothetical protein
MYCGAMALCNSVGNGIASLVHEPEINPSTKSGSAKSECAASSYFEKQIARVVRIIRLLPREQPFEFIGVRRSQVLPKALVGITTMADKLKTKRVFVKARHAPIFVA